MVRGQLSDAQRNDLSRERTSASRLSRCVAAMDGQWTGTDVQADGCLGENIPKDNIYRSVPKH